MARKTKAQLEKVRLQGEDLFINNGWDAKAIAAVVDVSEQTISKWRSSFKWDERRADVLSSPAKIKEILTIELLNVSQGLKPKLDCDALSKIAKVRREVSGNVDGGTMASILKEVDMYIASIAPKEAAIVADFHKKFLQHKAASA